MHLWDTNASFSIINDIVFGRYPAPLTDICALVNFSEAMRNEWLEVMSIGSNPTQDCLRITPVDNSLELQIMFILY